MKKAPFLLCALLLLALVTVARQDTLHKITRHYKTGYINTAGEISIPAIYHEGNEFSEGLAAVRESGLYGYIDTRGEYVIPPAFEEAGGFRYGMARVIINGDAIVIDRSGRHLLPPVYWFFRAISSSKAIISNTNGKMGLIDIPSGKLLIDTLYDYLFQTGERWLIATKNKTDGLFDTTGRLILSPGKYTSINSFHQGVALVHFNDPGSKADPSIGAIDTTGKLLFQRPDDKNIQWDERFRDGLIQASIKGSRKRYQGYMDLKGQWVLNDTNYSGAEPFRDGRTFIHNDKYEYFLVDTTLHILNKVPYRFAHRQDHPTVYAVVHTREGHGLIDKGGRYLYGPVSRPIDRVAGNYFFSSRSPIGEDTLSVYDLRGNLVFTTPKLSYEEKGFVNGLLKVRIGYIDTYFNQKGRIVWEADADTSMELQKLNIDHLGHADYGAYEWVDSGRKYSYNYAGWEDITGYQGWGGNLHPPALTLAIDTARIERFKPSWFGYNMYLLNTGGDTVRFNARTNQLDLCLQAQNARGQWSDIEEPAKAFCKLIDHQIKLPPGMFWSFVIPRYDGADSTFIRARLKYIDPAHPGKEKILYSNAIRGTVNPGQFTIRRPFHILCSRWLEAE